MNLEKRWTKKLIRHAVSEFSKKGLGQDYYGYHNIDHELQATYFTLLSANGHLLQCNKKEVPFSNNDIKYLFVSALFHDFDPTKKFDKPNEENVEWFLRSDLKIKKFIEIAGIDINAVIAIIYRTAYPFRGEIVDIATKRIYKLLLIKGLLKDGDNIYDDNNSNDSELSKKIVEHYLQLGWFLSVCERIAGYALGDFEYSNKLARSNAHALGWHPSIINEESVKYFDALLKQENEMCEYVLKGIPDNLKNNFFENVKSFHNLYEKEKKIRKLIKNKQISFVCKVEEIKNDYKNYYKNSKFELDYYYEVRNCIIDIYHNTPIPLKLEDSKFITSLSYPTTILITLRIKKDEGSFLTNNNNNQNIQEKELKNSVIEELVEEVNEEEDNRFASNDIVGYVKGGPLEKYKLRRGTFDGNYGKRNTAYMEWICMKPGYLGSTGGGGHLLRISFLQEAKKRGFSFVTGYVHRNVIMDRINKGEVIEILQKYNPDKLDYYRLSLNKKPNIV